MHQRAAHDIARRKVEARIGFFIHLAVFVLVNALLAAINLLNSPENLWFQWPLIGWGLGVAAHAFAVFLPRRSSSLKQRWIDRLARKQLERRQTDPT